MEACRKQGQPLTFAGVNAHHQNGMAERRIRSIQELARAMLIHANRRWPESVTINLWPYAVRMANDILNSTPNMQDKKKRTAEQIFSSTMVQPNQKHFKPFGCPVYVLKNALQSGKPFHKWDERARVGIYLGRSPQHSRNVALVLDRKTGLVSPQFHVVFDSEFHTVKTDNFSSRWQHKAGFVTVNPKRTLQPQLHTKRSKRNCIDGITSLRGNNNDNIITQQSKEREDRLQRRNANKLNSREGNTSEGVIPASEGGTI